MRRIQFSSVAVGLVFCLFSLLFVRPAVALDVPTLVANINDTPHVQAGLEASEFVVFNGRGYFSGYDARQGQELWRTDGTTAGTAVLTDINPHGDASPLHLTAFAGALYFSANDAVHGVELWRTDGTLAGTSLVKDIYTGEFGSSPQNLVVASNTLFFTAIDPARGPQLWKTDGTPSGTVIVDNVNPTGLYEPQALAVFGDLLVFSANGGQAGFEMWRSDGVTTQMVAEINAQGNANPRDFTEMAGQVYFSADNGSGRELWRSDGTSVSLVADIHITDGSNPARLTAVGNTLYFSANDGLSGEALWQSSGTGATLVLDVGGVTEVSFSGFNAVANTLYFAVTNSESDEVSLWRSEGSGVSTLKVTDLGLSSDAFEMVALNGAIFFSANIDDVIGAEVYVSDGTGAGTQVFANIKFVGDSDPQGFHLFNGGFIFSAYDDVNGREWRWSDGQSHRLLSHVVGPGDCAASNFLSYDDELYFSANDGVHGFEVWRSDGSEAGTQLVVDINPFGSSFPHSLTPVSIEFGLIATNHEGNHELWITDEGELTKVQEVVNDGSLVPFSLTAVDKRAYFVARDDVFGLEMWRSNGKADGTDVFKDFNSNGDGAPKNFMHVAVLIGGLDTNSVVLETLYFAANDGDGFELWMNGGTRAETERVADINPNGGSDPIGMTVVGDYVYFQANDEVHGAELWRAEIRKTGASLVADIRQRGSSNPTQLTDVNGTLFFVADNGFSGAELWKSDGSTAGTVMVKDIRPGGHGTVMKHLTAVGDKLYFSADDQINGEELWVSDGTAAGTFMLLDIDKEGSSSPSELIAVDDVLYFSAFTPNLGRELWLSDGTVAGTVVVADINPTASANPEHLYVHDGDLYFVANDGSQGRELWTIDLKKAPVAATDSGGGGTLSFYSLLAMFSLLLMCGEFGTIFNRRHRRRRQEQGFQTV